MTYWDDFQVMPIAQKADLAWGSGRLPGYWNKGHESAERPCSWTSDVARSPSAA